MEPARRKSGHLNSHFLRPFFADLSNPRSGADLAPAGRSPASEHRQSSGEGALERGPRFAAGDMGARFGEAASAKPRCRIRCSRGARRDRRPSTYLHFGVSRGRMIVIWQMLPRTTRSLVRRVVAGGSGVRRQALRARRQVARTALARRTLLAAALAGRGDSGRCLATAGAAGADALRARAVFHLGVHRDAPGGVAGRIGLCAFWIGSFPRS